MITIYGKKPCSFCDEARNLAIDLGENINYKDIINQLGYKSLADFFDKTELKIPRNIEQYRLCLKMVNTLVDTGTYWSYLRTKS